MVKWGYLMLQQSLSEGIGNADWENHRYISQQEILG